MPEQFVVDAFTSQIFHGNPAAVCLLSRWPSDALLQAIAAENNLSETAFVLAAEDPTPIRWFTPTLEVALCGHATLASAFVLFEKLEPQREVVRFRSREHGILTVRRVDGGRYELDFPRLDASPVDDGDRIRAIAGALGAVPESAHETAHVYLVELADEAGVRGVRPDLQAIRALGRDILVTAPADDANAHFVSRFFAPGVGIDEDPVTGSAHCVLTPFWAQRLGTEELFARQLSARGGELWCTLAGDRVRIAGCAVLFLRGRIHVPGVDEPEARSA